MNFIQTYSGAKFDFANPTPASIRLKDIAHALSRICRFGGHVATFYSVADHCVNVTRFLVRNGADRQTAAWGCMHDAAESYVGDIVSPFKQMLPKASEIEQRIAAMIRERFVIDEGQVDFDAVKRADEALLVAEAETLFDFPPLENWTDSFHAAPVRDPLHISRGPREAESFYLLIAAQVL